jgi:hypothetical protein
VRLAGSLTALVAAPPSLILEAERMAPDDTDPHCANLMDLTHW